MRADVCDTSRGGRCDIRRTAPVRKRLPDCLVPKLCLGTARPKLRFADRQQDFARMRSSALLQPKMQRAQDAAVECTGSRASMRCVPKQSLGTSGKGRARLPPSRQCVSSQLKPPRWETVGPRRWETVGPRRMAAHRGGYSRAYRLAAPEDHRPPDFWSLFNRPLVAGRVARAHPDDRPRLARLVGGQAHFQEVGVFTRPQRFDLRRSA